MHFAIYKSNILKSLFYQCQITCTFFRCIIAQKCIKLFICVQFKFCIELIGISQEIIDKNPFFISVLSKFQEFITKYESFQAESVAFVIDGFFDIRGFITKQLKYSKIKPRLAYFGDHWVNEFKYADIAIDGPHRPAKMLELNSWTVDSFPVYRVVYYIKFDALPRKGPAICSKMVNYMQPTLNGRVIISTRIAFIIKLVLFRNIF